MKIKQEMTGALQSTKHFVLHIFSPGELRNNFILLLTYNENSMATEQGRKREREGEQGKGSGRGEKRKEKPSGCVGRTYLYFISLILSVFMFECAASLTFIATDFLHIRVLFRFLFATVQPGYDEQAGRLKGEVYGMSLYTFSS